MFFEIVLNQSAETLEKVFFKNEESCLILISDKQAVHIHLNSTNFIHKTIIIPKIS